MKAACWREAERAGGLAALAAAAGGGAGADALRAHVRAAADAWRALNAWATADAWAAAARSAAGIASRMRTPRGFWGRRAARRAARRRRLHPLEAAERGA